MKVHLTLKNKLDNFDDDETLTIESNNVPFKDSIIHCYGKYYKVIDVVWTVIDNAFEIKVLCILDFNRGKFVCGF